MLFLYYTQMLSITPCTTISPSRVCPGLRAPAPSLAGPQAPQEPQPSLATGLGLWARSPGAPLGLGAGAWGLGPAQLVIHGVIYSMIASTYIYAYMYTCIYMHMHKYICCHIISYHVM